MLLPPYTYALEVSHQHPMAHACHTSCCMQAGAQLLDALPGESESAQLLSPEQLRQGLDLRSDKQSLSLKQQQQEEQEEQRAPQQPLQWQTSQRELQRQISQRQLQRQTSAQRQQQQQQQQQQQTAGRRGTTGSLPRPMSAPHLDGAGPSDSTLNPEYDEFNIDTFGEGGAGDGGGGLGSSGLHGSAVEELQVLRKLVTEQQQHVSGTDCFLLSGMW